MISGMGKLFVGGLSWGTNEKRLREYFETYGEVAEAVIMKDRATGRARGFGFVGFKDHAVAERVVKERHCIDGRMVEAKKAVPRDDYGIVRRCGCNIHVSPTQCGSIKKIFVGGLAPTVTEATFRRYFEQFGAIVDTVVMYDHTTRKPRGFGFITFDSEEAARRVLVRPFHQVNGKKVEVKRAIPKDSSPGPIRTPLGSYDHNTGPVNIPLNGYSRIFSPDGVWPMTDRRLAPIRNGAPPFVSGLNLKGYGLGIPSSSCPGFHNIWGSDRLSYRSVFERSTSSTGSRNVENPSYSNENLGYISGNDIFSDTVVGATTCVRNTENIKPRTPFYVMYSGTRNGSVGGGDSSDISIYGNSSLPSRDSEWVTCRVPVSKKSPGFIGDCSVTGRHYSRGSCTGTILQDAASR